MFGQIMFTHLRWTRVIVASMAVMTFMVPSVAWWLGAESVVYATRPAAVISGFRTVGPMLLVVGMLGAFLIAAYPWTMDAASKHVFPLSLPVPWRRYVAMRFSAGALLLLPAAIALWLGSLFILSMLDVPATLRVYPGVLALRFLAATLLTYAVVFALQYIAGSRSAFVVLVVLLAWWLISFGLQLTGNAELSAMVGGWLTEFPGPLAVFTTEWRLIDV